MNDVLPGGDGTFQEFELQICSNTALEGPSLINNVELPVLRGSGAWVDETHLLTTDANNGPDELIYTLVDVPAFGVVSIDNAPMEAGGQWTQTQITNQKIKYKHDGGTSDSDSFTFTVIDGEGGWIEEPS